jgi:hypothetical protein
LAVALSKEGVECCGYKFRLQRPGLVNAKSWFLRTDIFLPFNRASSRITLRIRKTRTPVKKRILKWAVRLWLGGVVLFHIVTLAGAIYQWNTTRLTERRHPPPGVLVDVGGHRLHIHYRGSGNHTVIIDAGLSGASYDWETVANGIARFAQVCTYDRAGYGWSDSGPRPRTSQQAVSELHTLLARAQIKPKHANASTRLTVYSSPQSPQHGKLWAWAR